mmetsp:Transcript_60258/g.197011  ORF Transcript_60258/g.197011 Transcript_60258/m.197011 type:complete len:269 (+) Transcript_60258:396-1202(+)
MLKEQVLRRGHHVQAVRLLCTHLRRAIGARPAQLQLQGHTVSHEVVHIGCPLDRLAVDPQQLVARLASQARGRPRDDQHAAAAGGRHSLGAPTRRRSDNWCVLPHRVIDQGIFERDLLSATASFVHAARQCSTKLRLHRRSWRSGFLQHSPSLGLLRHVLLGLLLLGLDRCGCRAKASAAAASGGGADCGRGGGASGSGAGRGDEGRRRPEEGQGCTCGAGPAPRRGARWHASAGEGQVHLLRGWQGAVLQISRQPRGRALWGPPGRA